MLRTIVAVLPRLIDSVRQYRRRIASKPAFVILCGGNQVIPLVEVAPTGSLQICITVNNRKMQLSPELSRVRTLASIDGTDMRLLQADDPVIAGMRSVLIHFLLCVSALVSRPQDMRGRHGY